MFKAGIAFIGFWIPNAVKLTFFLYERESLMYQGRENDICPFIKYNCVCEYTMHNFIYLCVYFSYIKWKKIKC